MVTSVVDNRKKSREREGILRKFRVLLSILLCSSIMVTPVSTANAADKIFQQWSVFDEANPTNVDPLYDLQQLEIGIFDTDPDKLIFWMHFKNPITQKMFVDSVKAPWALVTLYRTKPASMGGDVGDFRISTNAVTQYPSDYVSITANAFGNSMSGQTRTSLSNCDPRTWADIKNNVKWIGLSISRKCSKIPDQFWVSGYVDPNSYNTSSDFDYAPTEAFYVDLTAKGTASPTPTPTPTVTAIVQKFQEINYLSNVESVDLSVESIEFEAYSTSNLNVIVKSVTPDVCQIPYDEDTPWDLKYVELLASGSCIIVLSQPGNADWKPAITRTLSFYVSETPKPVVTKSPTKKPTTKATPSKAPVISGSATSTKKPSTTSVQGSTKKIGGSATTNTKTIICIKGSSTKTVTAVSPKCPTGYTLKK